MNPYEEVLEQVVDHLLAERDAEVANQLVRHKLVVMMQTNLTQMAMSISNAASHAGRTVPCYFDVERTFRLLGIRAKDLETLRNANSEVEPAIVNISVVELRDEDVHKSPQLDINQQRGMRSGPHIPKYLPPYPGLHTYRNTMMDIFTDRNYVSERERLAQHHLNTQRAINGFYLRTEATTSLFTESQEVTEFMVLTLNLPKKPAYLEALMPRDEVFDVDIYEFKESPNEMAQSNAFLRQPRLLSSLEEEADSNLDEQEYQEAVDFNLNEHEDQEEVEFSFDEQEDQQEVDLNLNEHEDQEEVEFNSDEQEDQQEADLNLNEHEDQEEVEFNSDEQEDQLEDDLNLDEKEYQENYEAKMWTMPTLDDVNDDDDDDDDDDQWESDQKDDEEDEPMVDA